MTVDLHLPEGPRGEPVVVITVQNDGGIVLDAGLRHEGLEVVLRHDVALNRVAKLRRPRPPDSTFDVSLAIGVRVDVHLDHLNVRVASVVGYPLRGYQHFGMHIATHHNLHGHVR